MQRTRKLILDHINRHGASAVGDLTEAAGVVAVTVRAHLAVLEREGLVTGREVRTGRAGRPRIHYELTQEAQDVFPKGYDRLARRLLQTLGSEARNGLISETAAAWAAAVAATVEQGDRRDVVRAAIEALNETGSEAEWSDGDGRAQVRLHNCPYPNIVQSFPQICDMERAFLQDLLQLPVQVIESGPQCAECVMEVEPRPVGFSQDRPAGAGRLPSRLKAVD